MYGRWPIARIANPNHAEFGNDVMFWSPPILLHEEGFGNDFDFLHYLCSHSGVGKIEISKALTRTKPNELPGDSGGLASLSTRGAACILCVKWDGRAVPL